MGSRVSLNPSLIRAFVEIGKMGHFIGARGDSVDNIVVNIIRKHCSPIRYMEASTWASLKKSDYAPLAKAIALAAKTHNGYDCASLHFEDSYEVPILIRQPNGTQQWPDILIAHHTRGMAIEIKSSRGNKILWNSGLPRINGIYIFNGGERLDAGIAQTTFFLGQHMITAEEAAILREAGATNHRSSREYNDRLKVIGSYWSLYARPMHNCSDKILLSERRVVREAETLGFVAGFTWHWNERE